jgi:hypothetical protein
VKQKAYATVVGDLVASRTRSDRAALHERFSAALDRINADLRPVVPMRIQAGDEFQGRFARRGEALAAVLRLRLTLAPEVECRYGVGWGPLSVLDESTGVEDGPGWWLARDAIDAVHASRHRRTAYRGPDQELIEAVLLGRDALLARLDARSVRILQGLLDGVPQRDLAEELGVSASAISQRVRHDDLAALAAQDALLREVP